MTNTIPSRRTPRARKVHYCDSCPCLISPGLRHHAVAVLALVRDDPFSAPERVVVTVRTHLLCPPSV